MVVGFGSGEDLGFIFREFLSSDLVFGEEGLNLRFLVLFCSIRFSYLGWYRGNEVIFLSSVVSVSVFFIGI